TLAALACAREAGCTLSYDPNYRANLWPSVEAAVGQMRAVVPQMDLMKLSDEECELLTGEKDPEAAAASLLERGPKVVAVTLGAGGAYVRTADGGAEVAGFPADAVDATGAGDSFWGGFLAGFCESGKAAGDVTCEDAAGFARLGNAVASLCVRKRGAIPAMPERADVEALLGE
ncbi:carbohydrate kinase family protein, partial [Thermophilibacter provencensis]|uniref:carbohydrate kinase family protein n=1 Tax=Thermophilibacter provencensis TaxID=1852386 RepID=UPI002353633F